MTDKTMKSTESELLIRQTDGVMWLTLNRPHRRNALTHGLYGLLQEALAEAERDNTIGCVVLSGAGGAFCAGGDVNRMNDGHAAALSSQARISAMRERTRVIEQLHGMPKPTIAMVSGAAVGAGFSLALACDLRFGDTTARMRTGFLPIGLSGDFGGHYLLPRVVGPAKARELYLLSSLLNAQQALALDLLNALHVPDALEAAVAEVATRLAQGPQPATALIKANLNEFGFLSLADTLDIECQRHVECVQSPDHLEAVRAFVDKRTPVFTHQGPLTPMDPHTQGAT